MWDNLLEQVAVQQELVAGVVDDLETAESECKRAVSDLAVGT